MNEYKIVRNNERPITDRISAKECFIVYRIIQEDGYIYESEICRSEYCSECEQAIKEDIEWRKKLNEQN